MSQIISHGNVHFDVMLIHILFYVIYTNRERGLYQIYKFEVKPSVYKFDIDRTVYRSVYCF